MKAYRRLLRVAGVLVALVLAAGLVFWARPVNCFNGLLYLRMAFLGAESRSLRIAGHRVHYYVQGPAEGRPVVLVHGLGGRSEDWRNLAPYLIKAGFRVYMPDLPGYGRSEQPADFSYSVPDEAAAVLGFMDTLGLKQVDLGGWSMGGWIVQILAARHPERIRHLILFDSAGIYEAPAWDTRLFAPATSLELDQLDALLMPDPPKVPAFIVEDILRVSRGNAWVIHRALSTMFTGHDTTDRLLPELKMPVLIVWGEEDHITPLDQGKKIHRLVPQSQLDVIAGCGHLAPVRCASQIGPAVAQFIR